MFFLACPEHFTVAAACEQSGRAVVPQVSPPAALARLGEQIDAEGLRLRLDPRATAAFDWPAGFGVVHEVSLDGDVVAWRDGAGWTVRTPGLSHRGPRRIVTGGQPPSEYWYTDDHYESFRRIGAQQ